MKFFSCYYIVVITFFDLLQKLLGYNYILIFLLISLVLDIKSHFFVFCCYTIGIFSV